MGNMTNKINETLNKEPDSESVDSMNTEKIDVNREENQDQETKVIWGDELIFEQMKVQTYLLDQIRQLLIKIHENK